MGCEPADIGKTIHPHPTLSESIGMAAEFSRAIVPTCLRRRNDPLIGRPVMSLSQQQRFIPLP
jgi:hypothetical protein